MEIKTVSIIGLGALGMGFGELLLSHAKENLRIVADEARIKDTRQRDIRKWEALRF